jgi:large subunit ribosomal protein L17
MRHQIRGRKLSRTSAHKKALKRNLLSSLFTHERVTTTLAKAKEFRPAAERLITLARTKDLHHIRLALSHIPDKTVVKKLFDDIAPRFATRPGGYTRILKLGKARLGDNAPRAILELVERKEKAPETLEEAKVEAVKGKGKAKPKAAKPEAEAGEAKAKKPKTKKAAKTEA